MECREEFAVPREQRRPFDIGVRRIRNEFTESRIVQDARAEPRTVARPCARNNGQSHQEGFACRSAALIGICVKNDVDIEIVPQIITRAGAHVDPPEVDVGTCSASTHQLRRRRVGIHILEHEPRLRHRVQNLRPQAERVVRNFGEIVKTPKDDGHMRSAHDIFVRGKPLRRREAEVRMRQPKDLFEKKFLHPRRVADGIAEHIVDRGHARRIEIADARDLHGRGLIRRDAQGSPARRMTREVKEDVDLIRMNRRRSRSLRHPRKIAVSVHHARNPVRHIVVRTSGAVDAYVKARPVISRKERDGEVQHHMLGKRGREIADADFRPPPLLMRELRHITKDASPRAVFLPQECIGDIRRIVECHQIIAEELDAHSVRRALNVPRGAQMRQRSIEFPQHMKQMPFHRMILPPTRFREQMRLVHPP